MERIRLYDYAGREITRFAQYDLNVQATIKGVATTETPVVYFHADRKTAYKAYGSVIGEDIVCTVPSKVLEQPNPVTVTLGYNRDGAEFVTPYYAIIPMQQRPRLSESVTDGTTTYIEGDYLAYGG